MKSRRLAFFGILITVFGYSGEVDFRPVIRLLKEAA